MKKMSPIEVGGIQIYVYENSEAKASTHNQDNTPGNGEAKASTHNQDNTPGSDGAKASTGGNNKASESSNEEASNSCNAKSEEASNSGNAKTRSALESCNAKTGSARGSGKANRERSGARAPRDLSEIIFDDRRDFFAGDDCGGIAVKVTVSNRRCDSGVRRNVVLRLVDVTAHCEVASQDLKVILRPQQSFKEVYAEFPDAAIVPGHTYRLMVTDPTMPERLGEQVFRVIDPTTLPHPSEWYGVLEGGLHRQWAFDLFKTIRTEWCETYYVRFILEQKLGQQMPAVMPELELRLFFSDGEHNDICFCSPLCDTDDDYRANRWHVDMPFSVPYELSGVCYVELLCMEYPIAGFAFDTDVDDERGSWRGENLEPLKEYSPEAASWRWTGYPPRPGDRAPLEPDDFDKLIDDFIAKQKAEAESGDDESEQSDSGSDTSDSGSEGTKEPADDAPLSVSLDHLTGLRSVKEKLTVYERVVRFNKLRADMGLPTTSTPLHAMFLGSPGTGKTTVAKMMGAMLHRAGVLSKGHVIVRERATLLGQNYNSEAEKTIEAIEKAQGGILFIDEAYQLYQPNDSRDPGKFVIETLLTALADESHRDWMLILAGYSDRMKRMFEMNPGFRSRIPDSNIYVFDDFTEPELMEIAENYLSRNSYTLSADARLALAQRLGADYSRRDPNFGNARHVINMIQTEILPSMAVRVTTEGLFDATALTEIRAADIPSPAPLPLPSRPRIGFVA